MRFQLGMAVVVSALGALVACSSSSSTPPPAEAGPTACSDSITNILNNNAGVACPIDANGRPLSYDDAITLDCASQKMKTGDVQFGPCLDFLVWEVDKDTSGNNVSRCYYSPTTHALVGVIYGDGTQDQCGTSSFTVQGGTVESYCQISGFNGGGAKFESCLPVVDSGKD